MSFIFEDWYKQITSKDVMYAFKGEISSDLITDVLTVIETKLKEQNESPKMVRKVYNVLVETLQNLYHHIDSLPTDGQHQYNSNFAAFSFIREKDKYAITTGNFVKKEKLRLLTDRMKQINYLQPDELKSVYKIILNNNEFSEKGGGGLGMIDIARKTGNRLDYLFHDYNTDYLFFSLSIVIG